MPKPICFMVMPYGKREASLARRTAGRSEAPESVLVDFDTLWAKAFRPLLEELGYLTVRADQDLGALIIHEMLARLALSDLVLADITLSNANVYYEVGVRHAARETGCVLVAAEGSHAAFDLDQMRVVRYPLSTGDVSDDDAARLRGALKDAIRTRADGRSPLFELLPGFPGQVEGQARRQFAKFVSDLSDFQLDVRAAREAPRHERRAAALKVRDRYGSHDPPIVALALELLVLLRDATDWPTTLDYIDTLPASLSQLPYVKELRCLAESKLGQPLRALAGLRALVEMSGDSSERQGLIAGRYKQLMRVAEKEGREDDRRHDLDLAIEHYTRGMLLDLNDYFPSSNLPRLLRLRAGKGDAERAVAAEHVARLACERALGRKADDEWLRPTLLTLAFAAEDAQAARDLLDQLRGGNVSNWMHDTFVEDLELTLGLVAEPARRAALAAVLEDVRTLVKAPPA